MSAEEDASRTSRVGEPLRILVVDDFAPVREILCSLFLGYEPLTVVGEATDGEAAIEMAFRLLPHIIVMDVKMPRISGVEATRGSNGFFQASTSLESRRRMTFL